MLTSKPSTMSPASLQNLSAKVVTREFELAKKLKLGESLKIVTQIPILKELESVCCYSQPINYQYQFAENIVGHSKEELFHINDNKYSTVIKALHYKNEEQYRSLETFYEQLIANCFPTVKLSTIKESKCTSLVTYPAPALIHIYYNVSPAYIIVQDLTQCGASKAMMIMNTLEDTMSKFDLGLKIVTRRSISKKRSKRALEKSQKSNKSVLWETKTHLMLPDNDAASTMSKVKDCRLYRTLVTYFKSSEQGTSSSGNHEIRSLDITCEVTSDQRTSSSAEHEIPSLDRIHAVTSADQGTSSSAEHDTSGQGTSSSAEHDIQSLDRRKHEMKLPFTAKTTKQVEEMECEIIQLKKTVRSLEDKFEESKRKLRAKEVIGVKSTETQTSKEQEEELQLKMNHLELTVKRLQDELRKSQEKTVEAEKSFKSMETYYKQQLLDVNKKNKDLNDKTNALKRKLQNKEEYIDVTLADLGSALVERDTLIKAMEAHGTARSSPVEVSSRSSQTSEMPFTPEAPTRSRGAAEVVTEPHEHLMVNSESSEENSRSNGAAIAVQESQAEANGGDRISLANIPTTTVERGLYFNYKLLLLLITRMLLSGDVIKFKEWASSILSVDVTASVNDVFLELDRRGAISAVDLEKLREFFEKILRIDLVYMVDCFMMGDYSYLRRLNNQGNTSRVIDASQRVMASSRTSLQSSAITSGKHRQSSHHSQPRTSEVEESYALPQSKRPDTSAVHSYRRTEVIGGTADAQGSKNATSNVSTANRPRSQVDMGNNGRKLSTFQRPDSARNHNSNAQAPNDDSDDDDDDSQWLCSHYKRLCYVKFDCCDKYWPCHRCHNNESKCGQKKLKSRDTKFLKCVSCGREEQFSSQSQFCTNCHKRFAKYFCAICKHLTGTDDNPYHCEKCAICRIHSDRSFHCDVCGVCLDVQLRGNHKCRAGSAHDECCICLEDAFTGCQILPCSHKVHKECATQMIRSGITRCPICRESFADKLERRNLPPPKKPPGK